MFDGGLEDEVGEVVSRLGGPHLVVAHVFEHACDWSRKGKSLGEGKEEEFGGRKRGRVWGKEKRSLDREKV